jgi:hypothetical protein
MMEHAGAYDLIIAETQIADAFNRELVNFEVVQVVFAFELLCVVYARRADIHTDHAAVGLADGVPRRLRSAAACNEYGYIFPVRFPWPMQVKVCPASEFIPPAMAIVIQIFNWRRIRMPIIKVAD